MILNAAITATNDFSSVPGEIRREIIEEQQQRAGAWALLSCLLRIPPQRELLLQLADLGQEGADLDDSDLAMTMSMLALAAQDTAVARADDEFHALFIGLGRGELVPFGSWYLTGFLMEKPLSLLRDDLRSLGYERDQSVQEPEDHISALCEVMSMMISEGRDIETQQQFYALHLAPWIKRFFSDLSEADAAVFYRAVGRFGLAFCAFENRYLTMNV